MSDHHLRGGHAAPVFPAETKPSPRPSLTSFVPILKELFFLASDGVCDGFVHRDHFGGFDQFDSVIAVAAPTAAPQFGLDLVRLAHKDHSPRRSREWPRERRRSQRVAHGRCPLRRERPCPSTGLHSSTDFALI
jgi:hypothetical protein